MMTTCDTDREVLHRCDFGGLCQAFIIEDGRRAPARIDMPHGLCDSCARWVRHSLKALPQDWLKLKLTIGESRTQIGGGRRPKPESRVLLNTGTDAMMRDIVSLCTWAVKTVAPVLRIMSEVVPPNPSSVVEYRVITRAVALVSDNVTKLVTVADGVEICEQIVLLHRRAVRQLGETEQREKLALPCPSCGRQSLVREVQDRRGRESVGGVATPEVVRCLSCEGGPNRDGTWSESDYRWLSTMVLSEREEANVLRWLLAEANWKLERLGRLAQLEAKDLDGIDAPAVVAMVREIVT